MTGRDERVQHDDHACWQEAGEGCWRALEPGKAAAEPGPAGDVWESARAALEERAALCLPVVGANRGGLIVEWKGMPGFVPASRLNENRACPPEDRARLLSRRVGETLRVCLIEVDEEQHRLVFSERAAAGDEDSSRALLGKLRPGDICRGRIVGTPSFGAFVDLGGIEGLIHISEISWDRLGHPSDLLQVGDEVQVQVVGVNPDEGRVALSLKRLRPNPWSDAQSRYRAGQIVEGDVTSVVPFGAFVRLEEGLEGLIHVSELAEGTHMLPHDVVREGSRVRVRVLAVDADEHRMSLSLRQAHETGPIA